MTGITGDERRVLDVLEHGFEKASVIGHHLDPEESEHTVRKLLSGLIRKGLVRRAGRGGGGFTG